jgi:hypothetical protein
MNYPQYMPYQPQNMYSGGGFPTIYGPANPYGVVGSQPNVEESPVQPDFTEERGLLDDERNRINELYSRVYGYLMQWENADGLSSRNPHLFLSVILPAMNGLIDALHKNTTARANLKKIVSDFRLRILKGEDDQKASTEIVMNFLSKFNEQRDKIGMDISNLQSVVPLNYNQLHDTSSAISDHQAPFDVKQALQATSQRIEMENREKSKTTNFDTTQFSLDSDENGDARSFEAPIEEYPSVDPSSLPEFRSVCTSDGSILVVNRYNQQAPGYDVVYNGIVKWITRNDVMYGVGKDGYEYELIRLKTP